MWRRLASASTTHGPGLANSLGVLGMRLDEAGRPEEALAAAREAVEDAAATRARHPADQSGRPAQAP